MRPAVALGVRLATSPTGRRRSLLVLLATLVGSVVVLVTWQVAYVRLVNSMSYQDERGLLLLSVVGAVALPVVVLAATVGRLSAALRDRRLANLRLLGLTPAQTRVVAAAEAGVAAAAGTVLGLAGFGLAAPLLPTLTYDAPGQPWWAGTGSAPYVVVGLLVPLVSIAVAVLPVRQDQRASMERVRRSEGRRPPWWRAVPLLLGLAASFAARGGSLQDDASVTLFLLGTVLTGLGLVLVVPVLVRLAADVVLRFARGPATLLTARRLQAQPAAVSRVVAALMVGLFLVVGARAVLVEFEQTDQYRQAAAALEDGQVVRVDTTGPRADAVVRAVLALDGVRRAVALPRISGSCGPSYGGCSAYVATCAQLRQADPDVRGCVDGRVQSIGTRDVRFRRPGLVLPATDSVVRLNRASALSDDVLLVMPPDRPGVARLLPRAPRTVVVAGGPSRDLVDRLGAVPGITGYRFFGFDDYDFVIALRRILWTLAAVVLGVGLLTFAIAAIDRAVSRRREVAALQLLGTPARLLQGAQWLEAALPTALGSVVAVLAGLVAGSTYLALDTTPHSPPVGQALLLLVLAVLASVVVAGLTVVATGARLTPDRIRAE